MPTLLLILGAPVHLIDGELIIITLLEHHRWKYTWAFSKLTKHEAAKEKSETAASLSAPHLFASLDAPDQGATCPIGRWGFVKATNGRISGELAVKQAPMFDGYRMTDGLA